MLQYRHFQQHEDISGIKFLSWVFFWTQLSWNSQIAAMSRSAFNQLRLIVQLGPYIVESLLRTFVHVVVVFSDQLLQCCQCVASLEAALKTTDRSRIQQPDRCLVWANLIMSLQFWFVYTGYLLHPKSGSKKTWNHVTFQNISPQCHLPNPPEFPSLNSSR